MYKIHVVGIANQNIKVDAYWYKVGDKIDCYLTDKQWELYQLAFESYEIITDKPNDENNDKQDVLEETAKKEEEVVVKRKYNKSKG